MGIDQDANTFFADWVLANYLQDKKLVDGRYGYSVFNKIDLLPPPVRGLINEFPAQIQDESHQFATHYYEFALPNHSLTHSVELEMTLQLDRPSLQDAWLQLVQLIDGVVSVQRFAAQDIRGQTMRTILAAGADEAFLAISPFTPSDRDRTTPTNYSLSIRSVGGAALTSTLMAEPGYTALMRAAAAGNTVEVGWLILNSGEDWRETLASERGTEALRLAAAAGYDDVVALLLLTDVNLYATDVDGKTALMLAEEAGHSDVVEMLRMATVEYDKRTAQVELSEDEKAFLAAASTGDLTELNQLIDSGVDLDVRDANGKTALMLAQEAGHFAIRSVLRSAIKEEREQIMGGFPPEEVIAFHAAARSGNLAEVERLLAAGIYVDVRDEDDRTALMLAARSGAHDIVWRLLFAGAVSNLMDEKEFTPLFHAIVRGHSDIASMLLLNDLRISNNRSLIQRDDYDRTALHLAAEYDQADIVRLLLSQQSRGLNVNSQALNAQKTALFPAARLGRTQVTELTPRCRR